MYSCRISLYLNSFLLKTRDLYKLIVVSFNPTVHGRECASCAGRRGYCGTSDGILNMKYFLLGHDVLRDYLHSFLTGNRYYLCTGILSCFLLLAFFKVIYSLLFFRKFYCLRINLNTLIAMHGGKLQYR